MNDQTSHRDPSGGISGRVVIVVFFALALIVSISAVTFIRRPAGSEPAAIENRPFGPTTPQEQVQGERERLERPLIYRGSGLFEPEATTRSTSEGASKP